MATMNPSPDQPFNIQVSGRHLELGDAFRTRAVDELTGAISKYFDRGGSAEVRAGRDGHLICVEINVVLATGKQVVALAAAGDAHAAFDAAMAKLDKQVRRYHRELTSHKPHNGGARSPADRAPLSEATAAIDADDDDTDVTDEYGADGSAGNGAPQGAIIAELAHELKSQTVAMAAMELEVSDAPVLLFRNLTHGGVSVVYRRKDGNIGWIDPARDEAASSNGAGRAAPAQDAGARA